MKIKTLTLQNLKSYPKAKISLSPTINLLIGENNSGVLFNHLLEVPCLIWILW